MIGVYTEQQARFDKAFCCGGSCCWVECEVCGRTYFVTSSGHGDYGEGELEALRQKADAEPDKFIEVPDFSYIAATTINDKHAVVGCHCDPTKPTTDWIESHAEQLTQYLKSYWREERQKAVAREREANLSLAKLDRH